MKLRSLFVAVAGALLFTAAFVPRADAIVVSYFNFEDSNVPPPPGLHVDLTPDKTVAAGGDNAGGGVEPSTSNLTINPGSADFNVSVGVAANVTTNPADQDANNFGINFNKTKGATATISFSVNTEFFANYSLSYATNNNGNGFQTVNLSFTDANGFHSITQANPQTPAGTVTFNLTSFTGLNGDGMTPQFVTFTLTFTNGNSNGNDLMTVIDNIRLDATTFVPEPSTVAGGLLGVIGLCWFQRRRIRLILPRLRRT
jgi:hypothetical protein